MLIGNSFIKGVLYARSRGSSLLKHRVEQAEDMDGGGGRGGEEFLAREKKMHRIQTYYRL